MQAIGLVGYGYWGSKLGRVIHDSAGALLVGVCDDDPRCSDDAKLGAGDVTLYDDVKTLLESTPLDGVVIATPAITHVPLVRQCLMAGKHVMVEKPLALTPRDARELADLAAERNRVLLVGHTFLYCDGIRAVGDMIKSGTLGQIHTVEFRRWSPGPVRPDIGVLWDFASHDLSILNYWFRSRITGICAFEVQAVHRGSRQQTGAHVIADTNCGTIIHVSVNCIYPTKVRQIVVGGSAGTVLYDMSSAGVSTNLIGLSPDEFAWTGGEWQGQPTGIDSVGECVTYDEREPLATEFEDFIGCIERGSSPISDGVMGVEVVDLLAGADESVVSRMRVAISLSMASGPG